MVRAIPGEAGPGARGFDHPAEVRLGVGQLSWGPTVWALTTRGGADDAETAAEMAMGELGVSGDVLVTEPRNEGATVEEATIEFS